MKSWSYRQLTQQTEHQLAGFIELAAETNEVAQVHVYRCMANGCLSLWNAVTMGWQTDDSGKRLKTLCDQVGERPKVPEVGGYMASFNRRSCS